jgi:lipoyl-dependent peroxiredoxin subunit D
MNCSSLEEGAKHLSPEALVAAKAGVAIMAMNNIFDRFQHLATNEKYATMRAGLRMNVMRTHGIDAVDVELWSTAVSAINGCGICIDSHESCARRESAKRKSSPPCGSPRCSTLSP